ncbi:hypothetical protein FQA47_003315 [Oryzias melastigma]|uniref:Uncharacterized protein n=1 Tax=Oryzias melastigma TaxID=30732 RepID=A0A834BW71_ORYME|nr:hypothetical protein FQA47_003315 [Oryzias melastigma]
MYSGACTCLCHEPTQTTRVHVAAENAGELRSAFCGGMWLLCPYLERYMTDGGMSGARRLPPSDNRVTPNMVVFSMTDLHGKELHRF